MIVGEVDVVGLSRSEMIGHGFMISIYFEVPIKYNTATTIITSTAN
jgi:hypothetical protein